MGEVRSEATILGQTGVNELEKTGRWCYISGMAYGSMGFRCGSAKHNLNSMLRSSRQPLHSLEVLILGLHRTSAYDNTYPSVLEEEIDVKTTVNRDEEIAKLGGKIS